MIGAFSEDTAKAGQRGSHPALSRAICCIDGRLKTGLQADVDVDAKRVPLRLVARDPDEVHGGASWKQGQYPWGVLVLNPSDGSVLPAD